MGGEPEQLNALLDYSRPDRPRHPVYDAGPAPTFTTS